MKVAAVHFNADLGNVDANMQKAHEIIKNAANEGIELIVFPEFFTSGFAFTPKLLDVVVKYDNPLAQLSKWSKQYNIIVAGSYLQFNGDDVLNTFSIVFPTGEVYSHSKDIPTVLENYCYAPGDTNRVFNTPIGNIGLVMCWEQIRYNTIRDLNGKVNLILAGSCWWGFSENDPKELQALQDYSSKLAINAPIEMAKLLNVPVVHASHQGTFTGLDFPYGKKPSSREILGATQIVDKTGNVLSRLLCSEDMGIVTANISLSHDNIQKDINKTDYWIPEMPEIFKNNFDMLNNKIHQYYLNYSKKYYLSNLKK